jgi:ornithine carbamoyltransferase
MREKKGDLKGLKLAYAGDIWNVCHSLMIAAGTMGFDIYVAVPEGYVPDPKVHRFATEAAKRSGTNIVLTKDLKEALKDADVVYANTWHSMGSDHEKEKRIRDFSPYQVNEKVVKIAKPDFIFMHCLPGYRGEEMTDEIIEGPHSAVWDQAENRMHTEKAVLALFVG